MPAAACLVFSGNDGLHTFPLYMYKGCALQYHLQLHGGTRKRQYSQALEMSCRIYQTPR